MQHLILQGKTEGSSQKHLLVWKYLNILPNIFKNCTKTQFFIDFKIQACLTEVEINNQISAIDSSYCGDQIKYGTKQLLIWTERYELLLDLLLCAACGLFVLKNLSMESSDKNRSQNICFQKQADRIM